MEAISNKILFVRVPGHEAVDGRELRDYILESLACGVLVLTEDASCEVMELPPLGGVVVLEPEADPPPLAPAPEESVPQQDLAKRQQEGEEKRMIVQRLKAYRETHGLGCFGAVARATRSRGAISEDVLRNIAADRAPKMELSDWRKIGRALDRLEAKEAADAQNT